MEQDVPGPADSGSGTRDVARNTRAQLDAEDADLADSLAALSRISWGRANIEDMLVRVAGFAVKAIPGADGAGLTLTEAGRADIIVKSEEFVEEIDAIQYGIKEGPCISAAATSTPMRSGSLGGDARWPRFGPRAGRLGVHSVLSLPLVTPSGVLGAMNIYAHAKDAFDERAEELGRVFAEPAAIAVHNAQILAQAERLANKLKVAIASRPIIDQAIGILRSRTGGTPEEAFERLRAISQTERAKLTTVATAIVDQAVFRARARHAEPD